MQSSREPDLLSSLDLITQSRLSEIHTAMPAKIISYKPATSSGAPAYADVKPTLIRVFLDDDEKEVPIEYPVITDVPIAFPRGGGGYLSFPLKAGDLVLLVFAQRSLDAWLETDGKTPTDPGDTRRHHISDAVAYPGLLTSSNCIPNISTTDTVLGLEDGSAEIHLAPGGHVVIKTSQLAVNGGSLALALASQTEARLTALEAAVAHTHVSTFGGGPTGPAVGWPGAGQPVASQKVFTDA